MPEAMVELEPIHGRCREAKIIQGTFHSADDRVDQAACEVNRQRILFDAAIR